MASINNLPRRRVKVRGFGTFEVPRHIQRIDIDDPGKAGTHGWQVRWDGTKFFGDASDGKRDPARALTRAERHLKSVYDGPRPRLRDKEHRDKKHRTGLAGVQLAYRRRRNRNIAEVYLRVNPLTPGGVPRSVYVGTENTVTQGRLREALKRARTIRDEMRAAYIASLGRRGPHAVGSTKKRGAKSSARVAH